MAVRVCRTSRAGEGDAAGPGRAGLDARLKVRRWQRACDAEDPNENAGSRVDAPLEAVQQMPAALGKLPRLAREKTVRRSITDPDARFLRARGGRFVLGYTAEIGASRTIT